MLKLTDTLMPATNLHAPDRRGDADAGVPQRASVVLLIASATLALGMASACGVDAVDPLLDAEVGEQEVIELEPACVGVCFDAEEKAALAEVQSALEACTPEDEASFENDPEGLVVSDIGIGERRADGAVELIVVIGRTSSLGHYGYPGTRLSVDGGGQVARALIDDAFGAQADEFAYGIEACGEFGHSYWVRPDAGGEVALTATVTTDVGEHDVASVAFRYVPAAG